MLNHWIHESVNSDLLSAKRGSHEDCCGCRFPHREIEEPFEFLRAEEEGNIL
jgi:hypothetical protein